MTDKKVKREERKRKKILAEFSLSASNDAAKRPGELLDSSAAKRERLDETVKLEGSESVKPKLLSDEEFKKLKKQLAERKKVLKQLPRINLQYAGNAASFSTNYDERTPILMSDVQHLLVYALCGNSFTTPPHRWCHLEKSNRLTNIVVLVFEGLTSTDFFDYEHTFPSITANFPHRVEVQAPIYYGSKASMEFSSFPVTVAQKERILHKHGSFEAAVHSQQIVKSFRPYFPIAVTQATAAGNGPIAIDPATKIPSSFLPPSDLFPRTYLLLSTHQMLIENFPLPFGGNEYREGGYKNTKLLYNEAVISSPMFALDCEMCMTTAQKLELTHIAVVNEKLEVIYETYVKPRNRITNYLTEYSGITKNTLVNVETRLEDVQAALQEFLPTDAILIGHSLNSDLHAMQMAHPYVIDTSVIYNLSGDRRRKSKLALLTKHYLDEDIQIHKSGHSPSEDATAAMKLVQLKLSKGFNFGDSIVITDEDVVDTTPQCQFSLSIFNNTGKAEKTVAVIGNEECLKSYERFRLLDDVEKSTYTLIPKRKPKETISQLEQCAVLHNFSLAHIDMSAKLRKCKSSGEKREKVFKKMDSWCEKMFSHVSVNGLGVVVFAGPTELAAAKDPRSEKSSVSESSVNSSNSSDDNGSSNSSKQTTTGGKGSISEAGSGGSVDTKMAIGEIEETGNRELGKRLNAAAFVRIKTVY